MIDLLLDHLLDAIGHPHTKLFDLYNYLPTFIVLANQPLCHKVIDEVDHKQRIPLCSFVDHRRKLFRKLIGRKSNG